MKKKFKVGDKVYFYIDNKIITGEIVKVIDDYIYKINNTYRIYDSIHHCFIAKQTPKGLIELFNWVINYEIGNLKDDLRKIDNKLTILRNVIDHNVARKLKI